MPRSLFRLRPRSLQPRSAVILPLRPVTGGRSGKARPVAIRSSQRAFSSSPVLPAAAAAAGSGAGDAAAAGSSSQAPPPARRAGQDEMVAAASALSEAVAALEASGTSVADGSDVDKAQRADVVRAATAVLAAAKNPTDLWMDQTQQIAAMAAARLFWEWGIFDALPSDGSDVGYGELAVAADAQPKLVARIGGVLTSQGLLRPVGADRVAHTDRSRIFVGDAPAGLVCQMSWENAFVVYAKYPDYFREYGRREPESMTHIPGTYAYGKPELSFYEMLEHDPARMRRFLKGMAPIEERMPIAGIYDFSWAVDAAAADGATTAPLFVDVGGGGGQAIKAIHAEFPGLPLERFVLQDRAEVIAAGKNADDPALRGIQRQAIDFHKEQPIKNAPIYWIRRCLHNYSDSISLKIVRNVADAMSPESRLLLQEDVLDDSMPPHFMAAMLDFMMLGFGGKQRTRAMWEELLGAAGLRISSVSQGKGAWKSLSVIECVKV